MSIELVASVAFGVYLGLMLFHRPQEIADWVAGIGMLIFGIGILVLSLAAIATPFVLIYYFVNSANQTIKDYFVLGIAGLGVIMLAYYWVFTSIAHFRFLSRRQKVKIPRTNKWLMKPVLKHMAKGIVGYGILAFGATGIMILIVERGLGYSLKGNDTAIFLMIPVAAILIWPSMYHSARGELIAKRKADRKAKKQGPSAA